MFKLFDFMPSWLKQVSFVGLLTGLALVFGFVMAYGYIPLMPKPGNTPGVGLTISEYDAQGLLLVVMGLVLIFGLLVIPKMARGAESSFLMKLLVIGFAAKMLSSLVRLWVNANVYGFRDVSRYDKSGELVANYIWSFDFGSIVPYFHSGTYMTMFHTGIVYSVIGPTLYGGFVMFGAISFVGSYFFYRAFRVAFPLGNYRLFGILIFLSPSVLYWPNGVGKDALMFLFLGLAAYGGALLTLRWRLIGLVPLLIGLAGIVTIREPVAWMVIIGLVGVFFLGRTNSDNRLANYYRVALLGVGLVFIWIMLPSMLGQVGLDEFSFDAQAVDNIDTFFDKRQRSTGSGGGSGFSSTTFSNPSFIPVALATALFRPFVWEAHNLQSMIQAVDGLVLIGLIVWRGPNIISAVRNFRSSPYVVFILAYSLIMVLALMTIANFGTLVRERAMLLPFILMLIAVERVPSPKKRARMGLPEQDAAVHQPRDVVLQN